MIHTKIKDLNIWGGNYNNIEDVPDNRDVVDSEPNGQIKPIWDGTQWVEGATPEEKNQAKTQELNQLREQTNELLSKTDWAFIRSIDDSSEVNEMPIEVINERAEIRANHEMKKQEIITKYS